MATYPTRSDINLLDGEFYAGDPHEAWTWMRSNAPVYYDEPNNLWAVTKYQDLKAISKDPERFSNAEGIRPNVPALPMMIDMDDPEHWNRRKLVNRGFTPRRVRGETDRLVEVCDWIIDQVCEKGSCDLVKDIAAPLPMIMIGDMLGVEPKDRMQLLEWSEIMLGSLTGSTDPADADRAGQAFAEYTEYATEVINNRRENPTDDLMSVLVHAEVDGDCLDHDNLVMESLLILTGGDETTRHVISGGMWALLADLTQRDRLQNDLELMASAVEEMLRWVSPIKNMARKTTCDVEVGGQAIGKDEQILLFYPSANRDEEIFEDPFRFDITRTPNDHVAFGFGAHFCMGSSLARLELSVMVERLISRLPDIDLPTPEEPKYRPANFIIGYEEMDVKFTPTESLNTPTV